MSLCHACHGLAVVLALSALLVAAPQDPELKIPLTGDKLTVSEVERRIQKLKDDKSLQEAAKTPLQTAYGDALVALQEALKAQAARDKLTALKSGAAEQRASLKQQLAAPAAMPTKRELESKSGDELAVELQQAQTASGAATRKLQLLDNEVRARAERQKTLPQQIVAAELRVRQAEERVQAAEALKEDPLVAAAQQTLAAARQRQAMLELDALKAELDTFGLASELLALERDLAEQRERAARARTKLLQDTLRERQQAEADEAARDARRKALRTQNAVLAGALREIASYAERWGERSQKLARVEEQLLDLRRERERVERSFKDSQSNVRKWGLTEVLGDSLRRERSRLPGAQAYRLERQRWTTASNQVFSELEELEELRRIEKAEFVADVLAAGRNLTAEGRRDLEAEARSVFEERRESLDRLYKSANQLSQKILELDAASRSLLAIVDEFETFLDEKILWIRSTVPIWSVDYGASLREWRGQVPGWSDIRSAAGAGVSRGWAWVLLVLVLAALARGFKGRFRRYRDDLGERAAKRGARTSGPTLKALAVTLALALPLPAVLAAAWLFLRGVALEPAVEMARAFRATVVFLFLVRLVREIVGPSGLAESHFGWARHTLRLLRRTMLWASLLGAPLLWLVLTSGHTGSTAQLFGRPGFLVGMVLVLVIFWRLFRPARGLLSPGSGLVPGTMFRGGRMLVFLLAVLAPIVLGSLAVSGFYFTAVQLSGRLLTTLGLLLALLVLSALITRWRLVTRRSLIFEQRRQQLQALRQAAEQARQAAEQARQAGEAGEAGETGQEIPAEPSMEQLDVVQVDEQTRKLISTILVVVGLLGVVAIWAAVFPALSLREVKLWNVGDGAWITLADLILSLIAVVLTIVAALNLPGFLKLTLFRRMKPGNQYAAATLVQYGIVVFGIVLSFSLVGIGWSKVQWLVAAVSLGLGFGLQEIFANFVSGLILLFEQPIRVGDFITVGDTRGEVTRIRIRATTIRNLDRQEIVVPNKEFITGRVVNWTLSDTINRITVLVGIAYGSNVELAQETLLRVAHENPYALDDPKPKVMFKEFGDSALVFELRIYIATLDDWVKATHSIHADVDRAFREAGIVIAFPQRDLHVKSVEQTMPFEMRSSADDAGTKSSGEGS